MSKAYKIAETAVNVFSVGAWLLLTSVVILSIAKIVSEL